MSLEGEGDRYVGLKAFHLHVRTVQKVWEPQPPIALRAFPGQ
jgi:hypothetical protein